MLGRALVRGYATKWPRPKPGTSERPPYRAPDPLQNKSSTQLPDGLSFVHRPPPTAPSPVSYTTNPLSPLLRPPTQSQPFPALPPPIRPSANKTETDLPTPATSEQIAEIRRLRALNPLKFTRGVLAKRFGCTQNFVGLVAATKKSTRKALVSRRDALHQADRNKWSEKRSLVVAIRNKRRSYW